MRILAGAAALLFAAGAAWAQDKGKPGKAPDPVEKRMQSEREAILRAVEKLLDERVGRKSAPEGKKASPAHEKKAADPKGAHGAGDLKEIEKLLAKQRDEILAAVRRMLDERLGTASKGRPKPGQGAPPRNKKGKKKTGQ